MAFQAPKLITVESFTVSGVSVRTKSSEEFDKSMARLPKLWQEFLAIVNKKPNLLANPEVYGVYSDYDSDANGNYTVTIGGVLDAGQSLPELSTVRIQAGDYLVFSGKGIMPQTVIETWLRVWAYFEVNSEYKREYVSDFELYRGADEVDIYIGITRANNANEPVFCE